MHMSVLYTSDSHVFHPKVAGERGFLNVDGTPDMEGYHAWYEDMWRSQVSERDMVCLLGDVTQLSGGRFDEALAFFAKLPGRKVLVSGNHDEVFPTHPASDKSMYRWLQVFEFISSTSARRIDGQYVNLSHFTYEPTPDDLALGDGEDYYRAHRAPDTERWLLHGHTHRDEQLSGPRQIHVGIDGWKSLVPETTIIDLIRENS